MENGTPQWLLNGQGTRPRLRWTFHTEAPLVDLQRARESGETILGDDAGGLCRLDRRGRVTALSRGYHALRMVATDDVGQHTATVSGDVQLAMLDATLRSQWVIDLPDVVTALAVSPYGGHLAVGLANGNNVVYDVDHRRVCHFETDRPLQFLRFVPAEQTILGAAEYGLIAQFDFSGKTIWETTLPANIGDLACTGDGKRISATTFTQGIKHFDQHGQPNGSYLLEGTPQHLSVSYLAYRLAVTTLEGHLYWLDQEGDLAWGAVVPEAVQRICAEPLGDGLICGFQSGRICNLGWI